MIPNTTKKRCPECNCFEGQYHKERACSSHKGGKA